MNKKIFLSLVFLFLLPLTLFAEPHFILHFDVNKTLIATDLAGGKSRHDILMDCLAEKYKAKWDERVSQPLSYSAYVKQILLPGPSTDKELKKARTQKIAQFLKFLEANNHPLYDAVKKDYEEASKKLEAQKTMVFPSFYKLMRTLKDKGVAFSLILRSFGTEIDPVASEIEKELSLNPFKKASFEKGVLHTSEGDLKEIGVIYLFFKTNQAVAVHDDWAYWAEHSEKKEFGKPFPLDLTDKTTVSLFFDDNIEPNEKTGKNIVNPIDTKNGASLAIDPLIETHRLIPTDTLQAILDEDYYYRFVSIFLSPNSSK